MAAHRPWLAIVSITFVLATPSWSLQFVARSSVEETLNALWEGLDVAVPDIFAVEDPKSVAVPFSGGNVQGIQIAGMYDTGTNLMTATLRNNFGPALFRQLCPINFDGSGHCFFNKHYAPKLLEESLKKMDRRVLVIAMVRSPLASITSWRKAPYGLKKCEAATNFSDDKATVCRDVEGGSFQGLSGVWNAYTQEYDNLGAKLQADGLRHDVMVVEYERLVLEPEAVVQRIAEAIGIKGFEQNKEIQVITNPAKGHGFSLGRANALQKLTSMSYLSLYPVKKFEVRKALCRNFNASSMKLHVVPLQPNARTYAADCD